jgi:serine O-acetyltransferase
MTFAEFKYLVYSDLYRYRGRASLYLVLRELVWGVTTKYSICMRTAAWLSTRSLAWLPLYFLARLMHRHYTIKYGINIAYQTQVGPGFHMAHNGGINVNPRVRIGRNCNLSQEVTIGISNRGKWKGVPTIGDNVYIGPGAKIFGAVHVGNNVAIGANCVVVEDVPDGVVLFGVPGRVIAHGGSEGYVNRTDYDHVLVPPPSRRVASVVVEKKLETDSAPPAAPAAGR